MSRLTVYEDADPATPVLRTEDPAVIADLGLRDEQQRQLTELADRVNNQRQKSFSNFSSLSAEERQQRFLDEVHTTDRGVRRILTEQQLGRLRQIDLQVAGPRAFDDPDVAAALKLTAQQKERQRRAEPRDRRGLAPDVAGAATPAVPQAAAAAGNLRIPEVRCRHDGKHQDGAANDE